MNFSWQCWRYLIAASVAFIIPSPLFALRFTEKYTEKGKHILVARDCKNFSSDIEEYVVYDSKHPCRDGQSHEGFNGQGDGYAGDAAVLEFLLNLADHGGGPRGFFSAFGSYGGDLGTEETILSLQKSPKPFDEVWLLSGGGDVDAGVGIARVLRSHGMTVEVPAEYNCVSACTLAFMGGVLRYIDPTAKFRVHSASLFDNGVGLKRQQALINDPSKALIDIALSQQVDARYMALRVMTLFQNTLALPLGSPAHPENDADFCKKAGGIYRNDYGCDTESQVLTDVRLPYAEPDSPERAADVALIRREGPSALQDILMRIERTSMALALDELEATASERGPRAKPALKMLRAMYMTSIKDTAYMSHLQLVTMGYITETF